MTEAPPRLAERAGVRLDTAPESLEAAARDFGGLRRGRALGVVRPESAEAVERLVAEARRSQVRLTPRGAGLSQSGQSVARDSLTVELGALRRVSDPDRAARTVLVEPGASFRDVLEATLPAKLAPKVMPLNLDLTVGGVLSAGGFGSSSHRHGLAVQTVRSLEVVVGTGERVRATRESQRRVFDSALGGLGRVGIITQAELDLGPVKDGMKTWFLSYDGLQPLLADLLRIQAEDRFDHVEAFASASVQGLKKGPGGRRRPFARWSFGLHVSRGFDGASVTDDEALSGLDFDRMVHVEEDDLPGFSSRYDVRFEAMRATGAWTQIHPWFEVLLPWAAAGPFIEKALEELPLVLGDGHRILILPDAERPAALAFPGSGPALGFALLPMGVLPAFADPVLGALSALHAEAVKRGGKRYPSGWLFEPDRDAWRTHYGNAYPALRRAQDELDPDGIFCSCLARL
jgi:cytokinin dehydrogenase